MMPTYDYSCRDCGETFTVREAISDHEKRRKPPPCPSCESRKTRRELGSFFAKTASKT
jgi:putative FmdB family regulatory protein